MIKITVVGRGARAGWCAQAPALGALVLFSLLLPLPRCGRALAAQLTDAQVLDVLCKEQPRDRAIARALAWVRTQQGVDGGLGGKGAKYRTVLTSLGVLAHLAAGITCDHPRHGAWLRRSLQYVLAQQEPGGYFGRRDGSRMYGHGIATLMLAEAVGMTRDAELEERLRRSLAKAVAVTVSAALVKKDARWQGGWRYEPVSGDADLSLSGWQLMSLHAAHQVGIKVPARVIHAATEFARRCTGADGKVGYQPGGDSRNLRGLGLLCFAVGGRDRDTVVDRIAERILADPLRWAGDYFFYRAYYDAVGLSRTRPGVWQRYRPLLEKILVSHQKPDGSWPMPPGNSEGHAGPVYATCMAILALAVERHVLPAYQR